MTLRIVLLGALGRHPYGGQVWLYLNWLSGLARLGHDVTYVEDTSVWPYDPVQRARPNDCAYTRALLDRALTEVGLSGRWALRVEGIHGVDAACWGRTEEEIEELYASCDLLLNAAGGAPDDRQRAARLRVWLQTDPVTPELRLANGDEQTAAVFAGHHAVATYGERFGAADCGVPLADVEYVRTRQPVDLEAWPAAWDPDAAVFTTVGNYRQPGWDVTYRGDTFPWSKHVEWERVRDLPAVTGQRFELALAGASDHDREQLAGHGWDVRDAFDVSLDPFDDYRGYLRRSRGAFTVAKDQNVRLRSGWFSEREACYLACGKPVVTQDTAFGGVLPTGEGLFAFTDLESAAKAVNEINGDYERQCRAARALAEEHFGAASVAGRLLADLGLS